MEHTLMFELGDPSRDGHGQSEVLLIKTNVSQNTFQKLYDNACAKTKLTFHEIIAEGYQDNIVYLQTLKKLNINLSMFSPDVDDIIYLDSKKYISLLMNFIIRNNDKAVIWEFTKVPLALNYHLGYGLFE